MRKPPHSDNAALPLQASRQLADQVALVTGASRGIGKAIALRFAAEGAQIALHYRSDAAAAEQAAEAMRALGATVRLYHADLQDPQAIQALAVDLMRDFGRLDVLVNNAGVTCDNLLVTMSLDELQTVLNTNLLAPMLLTQALALGMMRGRYGRIVNVSSSAAGKPGRGQSNYAAAKGGLEAFTRAMAVELAPRGILVNAVAPGVIDTEMSARVREYGEAEIHARLLVKRYADASEVADAVLYLASPRNRYVTGEILHLDGGLKMA